MVPRSEWLTLLLGGNEHRDIGWILALRDGARIIGGEGNGRRLAIERLVPSWRGWEPQGKYVPAVSAVDADIIWRRSVGPQSLGAWIAARIGLLAESEAEVLALGRMRGRIPHYRLWWLVPAARAAVYRQMASLAERRLREEARSDSYWGQTADDRAVWRRLTSGGELRFVLEPYWGEEIAPHEIVRGYLAAAEAAEAEAAEAQATAAPVVAD